MKLGIGSMVCVEANGVKVYGALADSIQFGMGSSYKDIMGELSSEFDAIDVIGGIVKQLSGKGFSSKFKAQSAQIWTGSAPATLSVTIDLHRINVWGNAVNGSTLMKTVQDFCKIPLPIEGALGNLTAPGPSLLEQTGIDFLERLGRIGENNSAAGAKELENAVSGTGSTATVRLGNIIICRLIMESAEPTFSKYSDEDGFPIDYKLAFKFKTIWGATQTFIDSWTTGVW